MAKTAQIKSSPQKCRAWGHIISVLTGQNILKFDWWVVIDVDYRIAKEFFYFFIIWSTYLLLKIGSN